MTEAIKTASEGIALVSEIIKAAGDSPHVKEAGSNLGKTAVTITKTINNALLPLAAVNFAFDKARKYFDEKFSEDLSSKVAAIPAENLAEPKASIAGPALQGLAFTHEEPNLKDMYINLLATAMDNRVAVGAHPAFVEIIKQLDATEAALLKILLLRVGGGSFLPIVKFAIENPGVAGYRTACEHLIDFRNADGSLQYRTDLTAKVENWIRLGLLNVNYEAHLIPSENEPAPYGWVENRPELIRLRAELPSDLTVRTVQGSFTATAFGRQFATAVGLL